MRHRAFFGIGTLQHQLRAANAAGGRRPRPEKNDFGEPRYGGPAPPKGHGTHHYHFKLAALDVETLTQAPNMGVADLWNAAEDHIIGQAELVGTYAR